MPETRDQRIARVVADRERLDDQKKSIQAQIDERDDELLALIDTEWEGDFEDTHYRVVNVAGFTETLDESGFRGAILPSVWNKVTRRMLDPDRLVVAIKDGLVEPDTVDKFRIKKPKKRYLRFSKRRVS